jgi:hypothetical protein
MWDTHPALRLTHSALADRLARLHRQIDRMTHRDLNAEQTRSVTGGIAPALTEIGRRTSRMRPRGFLSQPNGWRSGPKSLSCFEVRLRLIEHEPFKR